MNGFIKSGNSVIHKTFPSYKEQKSCYRFLSNPKVKESILIGKLQEQCKKAVDGKKVLAICDSSVVSLNSQMGRISDFEGLGLTSRNIKRPNYGYYMHPIYIVDQENGTPYGMADVHLFNRSMELNPLSKKERKRYKQVRTIEQKESYKWVGPCVKARQKALSEAETVTYVMDREADIWEVFERIPDKNTHIVVRSKTNRNILNRAGKRTKLYTDIAAQPILGDIELRLPSNRSKQSTIRMELRTGSCKIIPSQFNPSKVPVALYYVEIKEINRDSTSTDDPVHWILWTDQKVESLGKAKEIVEIYKKRWSIEVLFKLLKSDGFDIENSQLETGKALRKLALVVMDAAIKVLQLKAARSGATDLRVEEVFTSKEIICLKLLNTKLEGGTKKQQNPYNEKHLSWASWIIARLAGWTAFYNNKNPPGNKMFIRGIEKFNAIMIGFSLDP